MKKPQYKDTAAASICQAFYRQYMLSSPGIFSKKCCRTQNYIHYNQKLLKLTLQEDHCRRLSELAHLTRCPQSFAAVRKT
jgi:hypothetical protein